MESPSFWKRLSVTGKTVVLFAAFVGLLVGSLLGTNLLTDEAEVPEQSVECTTDSIGCTLQQLLFDLIPLLVIVAGPLVENDDGGQEIDPGPRLDPDPFDPNLH